MQLIYHIVSSCIAQWLSYAHIFLFKKDILFRDDLSQDIDYSSLCCPVRPCCLSILVYPYQFWSAHHKLPVLPAPTPLPHGNHKPVLYVCESVSVL